MIRGRARGAALADIAPRQASRVPAAGWLLGLDALDWAPAFDSESHVEHDAAVCHASDGVEVSLDDLRGLYEQESEAQDQLAERRTIEQRAAAESVQLGGDPSTESISSSASLSVFGKLDVSSRNQLSRALGVQLAPTPPYGLEPRAAPTMVES